jgi:CheY-like chemotaxis protein
MPMHISFRPRILLIGPADESRAALRALLEGWHYRVEEADDGAAGLHAAMDWRPEAAIVRADAPPSDGYEVGRALRAVFGSGLFLVIRVAPGQAVDVDRAFDAGFDAVFDGEADPAGLRALLGPALGVAAEADGVPAGAPA